MSRVYRKFGPPEFRLNRALGYPLGVYGGPARTALSGAVAIAAMFLAPSKEVAAIGCCADRSTHGASGGILETGRAFVRLSPKHRERLSREVP